MKTKKTNFTLRYDKHRHIFIEHAKGVPIKKSGIGYITREMIDRNKILDSAYLREILGNNKGRKMFEKMMYGIELQKSPSMSSVSSNDSIDKLIKKLSGKKLIYDDDELYPVKKIKYKTKVKEYKDKELTEYQKSKIDKYLKTPFTKNEKLKNDKYLEKDKREPNNFYTPLTKKQQEIAYEYLRSPMTKDEQEMIDKYLNS